MFEYINSKQLLVIIILLLSSVLACLCGLFIGSYKIGFLNLFWGILSPLETEIILNIRGPRVLLAILVGAALGVSGAALQGLFRNPLADPGLIGVSAGAALGAVFAIVVFNSAFLGFYFGIYLVPTAAIFGSLVVICLIYILTSGFNQAGVTYMLLVGIALNAIATVGIGFLTFISSDSQLRTLTFWMMGSLGGATWNLLIPAFFVTIITIFVLIFLARKLDIMQLGEIEAIRVGVNVKKVKMLIILASASMIGACVSLSGIVGFIGLVVPHLVRLLGGTNHSFLFIGSALMGITITVLSDLLSRIAIQPAELPIGLATSTIGAPFFLWLVLRLNKK